jgi:lipid-binding SYLF domain-containing protein
MKKIKFSALPLLLSLVIVFTSAKPVNGDKQTERIHSASNVLKDFGGMKEGIPHDLISKYEGVVIIPKTINAGLVVGGKRGKGVAIVKLPGGKWSDPVFVTITGGSVGPQIGVQSVDLILVFKHKGVLAKVKNGDFTIGGDISATAGPVGRSSSASSLAIDKDANHEYYGEGMSSKDIFETAKSNTSAVRTLKRTLASL